MLARKSSASIRSGTSSRHGVLSHGGSGGENDNNAMMFFLRERVEALQAAVNPDAGVILVHHTKKLSKQQVKDDPFLALSGASALRGYYTSGLILHRPDDDAPDRSSRCRNGPALFRSP
ncbi:AAA family ATPase [Paracoccus mutanolyticus]|nr:hypothetical protein [Paracoccus mutanolyticus]